MRWWYLLMLALPALAGEAPLFTDQEWAAAAQARPLASAPGWETLLIIIIGLGVVVALAVGCGWLARRLGARRFLSGGGQRLEVVESVQLAPRRRLVLVRVDAQWVLVGVGERELTPLVLLPNAPASPPFARELARLAPESGNEP
ncbi:MAG: flagellar biosynthetic protein FliO [Planctomycetota bacterium]|nr:flagellar biosynthetic protein FliO [Planctomycetota bacterium]MCX8039050.1 flagellar biosynthetic protein FliO [Planctomycetota bacterium]MDW8372700.1 flagellar biosynthetic protein FliO [Planctomycetota bacterium]